MLIYFFLLNLKNGVLYMCVCKHYRIFIGRMDLARMLLVVSIAYQQKIETLCSLCLHIPV